MEDRLLWLLCSMRALFLTEGAKSVFLNIVGGLLTVPFAALFSYLWRHWQNRNFKKIFGPMQMPFVLCYGSLTVRPAIMNAFLQDDPANVRSFPFAKRS